MNNETNINPNVETNQMATPVTPEQVPVTSTQPIEEYAVEGIPEVAAPAPAVPVEVPTTPVETLVPETMAPAITEIATAPVEVAPVAAVPQQAPVAPEAVQTTTEPAPAVPVEVPATQVETLVPETMAPAITEIATAPVEVAPVTPVEAPVATIPQQVPVVPETVPMAVPVAQETAPLPAVSVPTIETKPPVEVASNNFADFQMPETPTTPVTTVPETASPAQTAPVAGEIVGETKKGNKSLFIVLAIIAVIIIIVGIVGFALSKVSGSDSNKKEPNTPAQKTQNDITCSYDNVIRTINVHSEAIIKVEEDGSVSKVDYTHTYTASDQSALNEQHLAAIEYCATPGVETKLGKDTQCELKEGKIIITAYLEGESDKTKDDYKTALITQGFVCD